MRKFWKTNLGLSLCLMLCVCLVGIARAQDDGVAENAVVESAKEAAGDAQDSAVQGAKEAADAAQDSAVQSAKEAADAAQDSAVQSAKEAADAAQDSAVQSAKEAADAAQDSAVQSDKDKDVASVNGVAITSEDLEREVENIKHKMSRRMPGVPMPEDLEDKALENIINRQLLLEESRKAGIKVEDSEIEAIWQQTVAKFPSEEAVREILKKENVTEEIVRSDIRSGLTLQKYIESEFTAKADVSEEDIKEYYDKNSSRFKRPEMVKASHILIKVEDKADDAKKAEARKKIEEVEILVQEGKDFAELAKEYSEGPSSVKGGELGFFGRGQMVKPFSDAALRLEARRSQPRRRNPGSASIS